ncbi:MAG: NB-ARC domain-containing protein, partial [Bacteroidia bacterium]|nr:NB-ARC domain-containing protein [Bacteroidia bacterium]
MTRSRKFISKVKFYVGNNDLETAFGLLEKKLSDSHHINALTIIKGRHNKFKSDNIKGALDQHQQTLEGNNIANALLEFIDGLDSAVLEKVSKVLSTQDPGAPDDFIGRKDELETIQNRLLGGDHLLLLVNGRGGIGKTTLATHFYNKHRDNYNHMAWVLSEGNLSRDLLDLASALELTDPENPREISFDEVIDELITLEGPNLLVIDNANDEKDLNNVFLALKECKNFHILLTSRIQGYKQSGSTTYTIHGLSEKEAIELFEKHYKKLNESEKAILLKIREAVHENTLVLEILSKSLHEYNYFDESYPMESLLQDLQKQGLLKLESYSEEINVAWYNGPRKLNQTHPDEVIAAMYDLSGLSVDEVALLSVFSVLPPENIPLHRLKNLLEAGNELNKNLKSLFKKGWLIFNEEDKSFRCSPVIQSIVLDKNKEKLVDDCQSLIEGLDNALDYDEGGHLKNLPYQEARVLADYVDFLSRKVATPSQNISLIVDKLGTFQEGVGELPSALESFRLYKLISEKLVHSQPENASYKNGLAISYEKLGQTHRDLGNLEEALKYFEQYRDLELSLYDSYPQNVSFKNGLAISYSKLGQTHSDLGNLEEALKYF